MTSDEIIGFKKSSKINGLKLDETCRTPNSYFKCRVLIFYEEFVKFFFFNFHVSISFLLFYLFYVTFIINNSICFLTINPAFT